MYYFLLFSCALSFCFADPAYYSSYPSSRYEQPSVQHQPYVNPYVAQGSLTQPQTQQLAQKGVDDRFQALLQSSKKQITPKNLEALIRRYGLPMSVAQSVLNSMSDQKVNWLTVLEARLSPIALQKFKEGKERIVNDIQKVYETYQRTVRSGKAVTWDKDLLWLWVAQSVEEAMSSRRGGLANLQKKFQQILQILPERERPFIQEGMEDIIQDLNQQMAWYALVSTAANTISPQAEAAWFSPYADELKSLQKIKVPAGLQVKFKEPWVVEVFDRQKFAEMKDQTITTLWRNLQGVSGNFEMIVQTVMGEMQNLMREDFPQLYKKNMESFIKGLYSQFREAVEKAPIGIADHVYNTLSPTGKAMWRNGPHFYANSFEKWTPSVENARTLNLDAVHVAILGGIRDIEAKRMPVQQKMQETNRLIQLWKQRFQEEARVLNVLDRIEEVIENPSYGSAVWEILAKICQRYMTPKAFKALSVEFPDIVQANKSEWSKLRRVHRRNILPWGAVIKPYQPVAAAGKGGQQGGINSNAGKIAKSIIGNTTGKSNDPTQALLGQIINAFL